MKLTFKLVNEKTHSDSNAIAILKILSLFLFGLSFFSIPSMSFMPNLTIVTWGLTTATVLAMLLVILFENKSIKIDFIFFSFLLFGLFAFISSLINGMRAFVFTPILLTILSSIVYLYCKNNKEQIKPLLFSCYIGLILFMLVFVYVCWPDLISLNFKRLGSDFGDINDIALFMCLGCVLSLSILLFVKKWVYKLFGLLFFAPFLFCGYSSTSKSFIFILGICLLVQIFMFFGKKRLLISISITAGLIIFLTVLFNLPFMAGFKQRFLDMFSTLTQDERVDGSNYDLSTIDRLFMFVDGITMWLRKPIFGYGIQGFFRASSYGGGWSHNHFSETLASFGIIGAILFHFGFVKSFYQFLRKKKQNNQKIFGILFVFFIVSMFFVALNSQKIYAFLIPLPIAFFSKEKKSFDILSIPLFVKKRRAQHA